jgi:hypothetical protein
MYKRLEEFDWPKIGKFSILAANILEFVIYICLLSVEVNLSGIMLLTTLLISSFIGILFSASSMTLKFYHNYQKIYTILAVSALTIRFISIIYIYMLRQNPTEEFYLSISTFRYLLVMTVLFSAIYCILYW